MPRTWTADSRADVTFSLPTLEAAERAASRVARALADAGDGFTHTRAVGQWGRDREHAHTFAIVGAADDALGAATRAIAAAHDAGCTAVQRELWGRAATLEADGADATASYLATEHRP